jgi:DNA-binding IclR family transcriptional regulator
MISIGQNHVSSSIQVIDRMTLLLDAIARHDNHVSLKVLSAETGLHPSTAFRILASLSAHELVERSESGQYRLGIRLLQLSSHVHKRVDLREEAVPVMRELCNAVGETVNLSVRQGDEVVYIERAISKQMMRVEQVVGHRAPLHVTAVGKLMMAEIGKPFVREYGERTGLPSYTKNTITDVNALIAASEKDLRQGYSLDNEEAEIGVGCIGVLVRDGTGAVIGGLSISAPIERRKDDWIPLVRDAGMEISNRLGYHGDL